MLNTNPEKHINKPKYGILSRLPMLILSNHESVSEYRQDLDHLIRLHPSYTYVASTLFSTFEYANAIVVYFNGVQMGVQTSHIELIIRLALVTLCFISLLSWIYFIKKNLNTSSIIAELCTVGILLAIFVFSTLSKLSNLQNYGCKRHEFEYVFIGLGVGWRLLASFIFIRFGLLRIIFCSLLIIILMTFGVIQDNQQYNFLYYRGFSMLFYIIIILIILERIRYNLFSEKYISKELHKFIIKEIINFIPESIMAIGDNNKIENINESFLRKFGDINDYKLLFSKFYDIKQNLSVEKTYNLRDLKENHNENSINITRSNNLNYNACIDDNALNSNDNLKNQDNFNVMMGEKNFQFMNNMSSANIINIDKDKIDNECTNNYISSDKSCNNKNFFQVFQEILSQLKNKNNKLYTLHALYDDKDLGIRTYEIKIKINLLEEELLLIIIIEDITNIETIAYLKDTIKYKNDLLSSFSHELRTPLNYQINYLEAALNDKNINESLVKSYILPILRSAKLLNFLIKDILDLSSLNNQTLFIDIQPLSIRKTIKECIELIEFQATKKKYYN